MREIKFRAWDKKQEEKPYCMYRVYKLYFDVNNVLYGADLWTNDGDGSFMMRQSRDIVLTQYTGLKDKNGKEIYEGDILGQKDVPDSPVYEVRFHEGCWTTWEHHGLEQPANVENLFEHERHGNLIFLEVIGNIYATPELLKETT